MVQDLQDTNYREEDRRSKKKKIRKEELMNWREGRTEGLKLGETEERKKTTSHVV